MLWVLFAGIAFCFAVGGIAGAPWVPVRKKDINTALKLINSSGVSNVIELGCGDGRLLAAIATKNKQVKATGYEINLLIWFVAWLRCIRYYPRVRVRFGDFWRTDWSNADMIITFLVPRTMSKLEKQAKQKMKKGGLLLSYVFSMPSKECSKKEKNWYVYRY